MSSGGKRIVYNFQERLVSSDHNREQAFEMAVLAEHLRQVETAVSTPGGGYVPTQLSTVPAERSSSILHGLMVVVPLGSAELAVTPGAVVFVDPDGASGSTVPTPPNPDDSAAKYCVDEAGVLAGSGTLVLTPNTSGATRVDLVEIQRAPGQVVEIDNRDIFDPGTGTYTPSTVNKVVRDGVAYRIRTGTPGGGIPAVVAGWVPIACVSVPNGATTFDPCVVYDVRPLVTDRGDGGAGARTFGGAFLSNRRPDFYVDPTTTPGALLMSGYISAADPGSGHRAGGEFVGFDLRDVNNHSAGHSVVANALVAVWLLFPRSLPRWVRYSTVAVPPFGGRAPIGVRGILTLTSVLPAVGASGFVVPGAPIALPPACGLGGPSVVSAVLVGVLANSSTPGVSGCVAKCVNGRMTFGVAPGVNFPSLLPGVVPGVSQDDITLTFGATLPYGARSVLLYAACDFNGPATTPGAYAEAMAQARFGGGEAFLGPQTTGSFVSDGAGLAQVAQAQWVDLMVDRSNIQPTVNRVVVNWNQPPAFTKSNEIAFVSGWEL